jgi:hypothetical protein
MARRRGVGIFVAVFILTFACLSIDSIGKHRLANFRSQSSANSQGSDPLDPFSDVDAGDQSEVLVPMFCPPPSDGKDICQHLHGWPISYMEYDAEFESIHHGKLSALNHISDWHVDWTLAMLTVAFFLVISWLVSICVCFFVLKTATKITLPSFFAAMTIAAFAMVNYRDDYVPHEVNVELFHVQQIVAGLSHWLATIACYLSVVVAFHPRFVYIETLRRLSPNKKLQPGARSAVLTCVESPPRTG